MERRKKFLTKYANYLPKVFESVVVDPLITFEIPKINFLETSLPNISIPENLLEISFKEMNSDEGNHLLESLFEKSSKKKEIETKYNEQLKIEEDLTSQTKKKGKDLEILESENNKKQDEINKLEKEILEMKNQLIENEKKGTRNFESIEKKGTKFRNSRKRQQRETENFGKIAIGKKKQKEFELNNLQIEIETTKSQLENERKNNEKLKRELEMSQLKEKDLVLVSRENQKIKKGSRNLSNGSQRISNKNIYIAK